MKREIRAAAIGLALVLSSSSAWAQRAPRAPAWTEAPDFQAATFAPALRFASTPTAPLFQVITNNPTIAEFVSVDHDATDAGAAVITSYDVTLYLVGQTAPAKPAVNIGKPPLVAGKVSYSQFNTVWAGLPAGQYNATVTAKGPGGAATAPISPSPFQVGPRPPAAPGPMTFRQ